MVLSDLIQTITGASTLVVTVKEANEAPLIKFFTGGESQLSDELLARKVTTVKIENQTSVIVELEKKTSTP